MGCGASSQVVPAGGALEERSKHDIQVLAGARTVNLKGEDRYSLLDATIGGEAVSLALVADGHGGKEASSYCAERVLPLIVERAANGSSEALAAAAASTFQSIHDELRRSSRELTAGSTLTVCAVNPSRRQLNLFNAGDSLALLAHAAGFEHLGETHRLEESEAEQERVVQAGGKLGRAMGATEASGPVGPLRAYPGGLAVTRGVGDSDCPCLSPTPYCTCVAMPPDGGALMMCSDGVWDRCAANVTRVGYAVRLRTVRLWGRHGAARMCGLHASCVGCARVWAARVWGLHACVGCAARSAPPFLNPTPLRGTHTPREHPLPSQHARWPAVASIASLPTRNGHSPTTASRAHTRNPHPLSASAPTTRRAFCSTEAMRRRRAQRGW